MPLRPETIACLERLDAAIDQVHLAKVAARQAACRWYQPVDHLPTVVYFPPDDWPVFRLEEIQTDREKMLLSELAAVYAGCLLRDDRLFSIRANHGTSIVPSLFGCEVRAFPNHLPVALALKSDERIRELVDAGIPDLRAGQGGKVFDTIAFYHEALAPYPMLKRHVSINLADIQGPFDAAEIIWGSPIFLACYDDPELVHRFLSLVTDTVREFIHAHRRLDGEAIDGTAGSWGSIGRVCVREDAAVNLSGTMYDRFSKPYTERLLQEFGGWVHWCGDGKAWWRSLISTRGLNAVNPFQAEFYDPIELYGACRAQQVSIVGWCGGLSEDARASILTGLTLLRYAKNLDSARAVFESAIA